MTTESDAVLVRRAREGDALAFEGLVRRHLRVAHAVALSLTVAPQDAEDVCQDAFITALERLEDCRDPERFRSWFLAIVRNRAHNVRRYEARRRGAPLDPDAPSSGPGPAGEAERSRLRQDLTEALGEIPELQRQVVLLHDLEGWSHREVGEELGITEGSSRVYLHKARKALRVILGPRREEDLHG